MKKLPSRIPIGKAPKILRDVNMERNEAIKKLSQIKIDDEQRKTDFTISFCGVFSSGKSSILNNLLDCADFKLPVGVFPITKVITRIRYGKTLKFYCSIGIANECRSSQRMNLRRWLLAKLPCHPVAPKF